MFMKRVWKRTLALLAGAVLSIAAAVPAGAAWQQNRSGQWSYQQEGALLTGWQWLGGAWYHFDSAGLMQTGWIWDVGAGAWYYCSRSGAMARGWQWIDGAWYFLDGSGVMRTGWVWNKNNWYFLKNDGAMATGWLIDGGRRYYLDASGKMAVGTVSIDGVPHYFQSDGTLAADPSGEKSSWPDRVLELVNQARAAEGISALAPSASLQAGAAVRAEECVRKFDHLRPDGREWSTIFEEIPQASGKRGENLARNYPAPEAVVEAWLKSPGHRENLLNPEFSYVGTAVYQDSDGACYWAQLLAQTIR